ncbi:MAG TPA: SpoIIE family protein phosphatase [Thermoflexia bacterium]|nr:SpoIIE family protein phosphatase [Thermoflexia bacterium]
MHLSVAVAKVNKWAVRQGGDTVEMLERPDGGLSIVLVDGQRSGPAAKAISVWVTRKVVAELAEGVRDGAAARAANDALYTLRNGRVSATLVILTIDLATSDLVVTRCGGPPIFIYTPEGGWRQLRGDAPTLGFYLHARPDVETLPLQSGLMACAFTDGLLDAGCRTGRHLDIPAVMAELWQQNSAAKFLVDGLLARAMKLDDNRPTDDTSIAALYVQPGDGTGPRYMQAEMPVPDV